MSRLFNFGLVLFACLLLARPGMAAEPVRLMILGDSLTAGYGLPAEEAFPERLEAALNDGEGAAVQVINAGVSGDTTAGGLSRLDWALADNPTHVLVELGANDGLRGLDPAMSERNLQQIIEKLQDAGVEVMLAGMYAPPNLGREYGEAFNGIYPRLAAEYEVPLYRFFLEGVATIPELNQGDGIHPNARGVEVIVENIAPAVRAFIEGDEPAGTENGGSHG